MEHEIGDKVLIPINGEFMHEEQICLEYEVVKAFRCKVQPEDQVVAEGQEPMPEWLPYDEEMPVK
jgi:hypothetical protein